MGRKTFSKCFKRTCCHADVFSAADKCDKRCWKMVDKCGRQAPLTLAFKKQWSQAFVCLFYLPKGLCNFWHADETCYVLIKPMVTYDILILQCICLIYLLSSCFPDAILTFSICGQLSQFLNTSQNPYFCFPPFFLHRVAGTPTQMFFSASIIPALCGCHKNSSAINYTRLF